MTALIQLKVQKSWHLWLTSGKNWEDRSFYHWIMAKKGRKGDSRCYWNLPIYRYMVVLVKILIMMMMMNAYLRAVVFVRWAEWVCSADFITGLWSSKPGRESEKKIENNKTATTNLNHINHSTFFHWKGTAMDQINVINLHKFCLSMAQCSIQIAVCESSMVFSRKQTNKPKQLWQTLR